MSCFRYNLWEFKPASVNNDFIAELCQPKILTEMLPSPHLRGNVI